MKIYNSATHTKEEFVPHEPGKVSMYTCGPTVYLLLTSAICAAISWRTCWRSCSAMRAMMSPAS